eukprot:GHVL01015568.1.p1 GENE.GHVL01015568.1~~GHVL01015568.1.p1  ORF type:complete len:586 (+),score=113.68 GHVL01015568.1:44-1759(+)
MDQIFENVSFWKLNPSMKWSEIESASEIRINKNEIKLLKRNCPIENTNLCRLSPTTIGILNDSSFETAVKFQSEDISDRFMNFYETVKKPSKFMKYDTSVVDSYFQYYGKLLNQANMLQDNVRTSTYRAAILENAAGFRNKTVMDIGAGSGILSFFCAQAGAAKIYAVEASKVADVIPILSDANPWIGKRIQTVHKILEDITSAEIPEKVDILVSEPIGTFLFNERMIESFLDARDRFLKPDGYMYPNKCVLFLAPFSDQTLYNETIAKSAFWRNSNFYGVNLTVAEPIAVAENFRQPVVDYIDPSCIVSQPRSKVFDFKKITATELEHITIPFRFGISTPCLIHGVAGWFDVLFEGPHSVTGFSTAPWCTGTHWYQIRFLLKTPLAVNAGQSIEGFLSMKVNNHQSYDIHLRAGIEGTNIVTDNPDISLKEPDYRFYTSGNYSNAYWNTTPQGTAQTAPVGGNFRSTNDTSQTDPTGHPLMGGGGGDLGVANPPGVQPNPLIGGGLAGGMMDCSPLGVPLNSESDRIQDFMNSSGAGSGTGSGVGCGLKNPSEDIALANMEIRAILGEDA